MRYGGAVASRPPIRDQPRAEVLIRRRRVVSACLWIAAPGLWLTRAFLTGHDAPVPGRVEFFSLLIASCLLMVSAVGLHLRPGLARGIGMAAITLGVVGLSGRAVTNPAIAFVGITSAALLGFGLLTTEADLDLVFEPRVAGLLWSRTVLISAVSSLMLAGAAVAERVAPESFLDPLVGAQLAAAGLVASLAERDLVRARRAHALVFTLPFAATVLGVLLAPFSSLGLWILSIRLVFAIAWAARERRLRTDLIGLAHLQTAPFVLLSFGLAAAGGAMLLALPMSSSRPTGVNLVDALFTAVSAVCVTGLATLDTGADFTRVGQLIILLLIQVGGLGIMTLSAIVTLFAGRSLSGGAERALGEAIGSASTPAAVLRTVRAIAISTVSIEALGAILLFGLTRARFGSFGEAAWFSVFHSISAFCNAGFALQGDSLVRFADEPGVLWVVSLLIITGGAGFGVMWALARSSVDVMKALDRRHGRWSLRPAALVRMPVRQLNVQVVLATNLALLAVGFVSYLLLEWSQTLDGLGFWAKLHNAWFQAVTFRTAGFNTVALERMRPATMAIALVLMFIGASPGSTGGGIKTTTAAVLFLSLRNVFDGRLDAEAFGRRIGPEVVRRATAVMMLSIGTVFVGTFLLLLTQDAPVEVLVFEATSAVGTVGLTIGGTSSLDDTGKVIVMLLMFMGRVGPLTAAALLQQGVKGNHRFPRGEVIVG
jgi:trk system potassium uptake protein TrkH